MLEKAAISGGLRSRELQCRLAATWKALLNMFRLVCMTCGQTCSDPTVANCPHDGGVLDVRYDSDEFSLQPQLPGIWRYADRLPLTDAKHIISLGEGDTPLLPSAQLGPEIGLPRLHFKNEGLNPTGSYKDRIASVGITYLRQLGRGGMGGHLIRQCRRVVGGLWRARGC